ncbi:sensor domain-containing diguanylate cyclase [Sphingomonas sp.]|jgi:diguanylate cyclase (GGDEF)-like protein|uniref:sensor domain-containing diguanylate cyclase n=1 Tax=Sphingomonas sp. TaxID=28214 RepID=UPI002D7E9142|nr:sensor domain-containing diguanylate cyclase [Sphingomonas sp.]HEU0043836.1 sensor domain-containing diguanylate cyclase [Sphingomonas sp.]
MSDPKLADEAGRLAALERYCALDTEPEPAFEKITTLVKSVIDVPICAVSIIGKDRQLFKSIQGLAERETPRDVAFCDHTIRKREAMVVPDARIDARFAANPLVTGAPRIVSYAGVPLETSDGYNLGALCVIDTRPRDFTPAEVTILGNFARLVIDEFELRAIANNDYLTGAMTRRAFTERAEQELARHRRYSRPCSLISFDVDHFKSVNDTYGHPIGDEVLKTVVRVCEDALRPTDILGRLGGEEFAVLLPETPATDALRCAERLRATLAQTTIAAAPGLRVTASFGVAPLDGAISTVSRWLADADAALYAAKRSGRNRHVLSSTLFQQDAA